MNLVKKSFITCLAGVFLATSTFANENSVAQAPVKTEEAVVANFEIADGEIKIVEMSEEQLKETQGEWINFVLALAINVGFSAIQYYSSHKGKNWDNRGFMVQIGTAAATSIIPVSRVAAALPYRAAVYAGVSNLVGSELVERVESRK